MFKMCIKSDRKEIYTKKKMTKCEKTLVTVDVEKLQSAHETDITSDPSTFLKNDCSDFDGKH